MGAEETVRRLSGLRDLRKEVDELSQRIARLRMQASGNGGRFGGALRSGTDGAQAEKRAAELEAILQNRCARCMEELGELYRWIDDLPDSRLRRIFSFRYIDGLTWMQVAWRMGETDEQVPRRLHNKYLEAHS